MPSPRVVPPRLDKFHRSCTCTRKNQGSLQREHLQWFGRCCRPAITASGVPPSTTWAVQLPAAAGKPAYSAVLQFDATVLTPLPLAASGACRGQHTCCRCACCALCLQQQWRFEEPLEASVNHGVPCSWLLPVRDQKRAEAGEGSAWVQPCPCLLMGPGEVQAPSSSVANVTREPGTTPTKSLLPENMELCQDGWEADGAWNPRHEAKCDGKDHFLDARDTTGPGDALGPGAGPHPSGKGTLAVKRKALFPRPPHGFHINLEQYAPDVWVTLSLLSGTQPLHSVPAVPAHSCCFRNSWGHCIATAVNHGTRHGCLFR